MGGRRRRPGYVKVRTDYARGRVAYTAMYEISPGEYLSAGTFANVDDAQDAWTEKVSQARRGVHVDPRRGRTTFEDFTIVYLETVAHAKANTKHTYRGTIERQLIPTFGQLYLSEIGPEAVAVWVRRLRDHGYAASTIRSYKSHLSAIMSAAVVWGYGIAVNPCLGVKVPKEPPARIRALSQASVLRLFEALNGPIARLLVELDLQTGCRWGEITELRGGDVIDDPRHDDRVYLRLERAVADVGALDNPLNNGGRFFIEDTTKGGTDRRIGLSSSMSARLWTHIRQYGIGEHDLLFPYGRLKDEWAQAQIPTIAPHLVDEIPDDLGRTEPNAKGRTYAHGTCTAYQCGPCKCFWCRRAFAMYRAERRAQGLDLRTSRDGVVRGKNLTDHCPDDWFRDNIWKPAVAHAGLRAKTVFHDLRHTHATWLAGNPDFDIERLRRRMGHKSIITTQRYISASEEVDPDGADLMDQMLTGPRRRQGAGLTAVV
jgi:integrase